VGLCEKIITAINKIVTKKTTKNTASLKGVDRKKIITLINIKINKIRILLRITRGSLSRKPEKTKRRKKEHRKKKVISPRIVQKFISPKLNNEYLFVNL